MRNKNIGKWLRYYRKAARLSVNDVIDIFKRDYEISYTNKAIYGWESGQNYPPADTFLILCKIYHITNITESMGYGSSSNDTPILLTEQEEKLITEYRSNKKMQPAIHKLLNLTDS